MGLVFAFGGSSVVGLGDTNGGWTARTQTRFNSDYENHVIDEQHVLYNRGRTAELVTKTLLKVKQDVLIFESEPLQKLAIINSGIIDAAFHNQKKQNLVPLRDYIICKRKIITTLKKAGFEVAILAPPPMIQDEFHLSEKVKYIAKDRTVYGLADMAVAHETDVSYILPDYQSIIQAGKPINSRDGFHSTNHVHQAKYESAIEFIYGQFGNKIIEPFITDIIDGDIAPVIEITRNAPSIESAAAAI